MTFDDALAVLELDPASAPGEREIRAAYVRLIKVHKPERDPARFQAIREAYERAKQGRALVFGDFVAPLSEREDGSTAHASAPASAPVPDAADLAPVPVPEPLGPPGPPADPGIERLLGELDGAPDDDARLAVLLRAVEEYPRESGFRWELYDHYRRIDEPAAALRTLEGGVALELPGFLDELAITHPTRVQKSQIATLVARGADLPAIHVWLAQGNAAAAADHFHEVLAQAATQHHRRLSRAAALHMGVVAVVHDAVDLAHAVASAVRERPECFGRAEGSQVLEAYLRELLDVAPHLSEDALRLVAHQLLVSPHSRSAPLATLRAGDRRGADLTRATLEKYAPTLARKFGPLLGSASTSTQRYAGPAPAAGDGDGFPWRGLFMFLIVMVQVGRMCSPSSSPPRPFEISSPLREERPRSPETLEDPAPPPVASPPLAEDDPLLTTARGICRVDATLCERAMGIVAQIVTSECTATLSSAEALENDCALTDARDVCRELTIITRDRCGGRR